VSLRLFHASSIRAITSEAAASAAAVAAAAVPQKVQALQFIEFNGAHGDRIVFSSSQANTAF
jgi:hypothetical protein